MDSCFITLSLRREKQGLIIQLPFQFRGHFPWFAHNLQRIPVIPSTFTLSSHVKSFFHAGLNPPTLCLTFDLRTFLVTGSDSESSPLSADELHDLSADSTLDSALEEPGAVLVELKKPSIVRWSRSIDISQ
jgi:hypothetical protein